MKLTNEVTLKKVSIGMVIAVLIFLAGLIIGNYTATSRMDNEVEKAKKNANEKVEEIQNRLLPNQYLAQVNLYAQIISDLKEYRSYLQENNIEDNTIDRIIEIYICDGKNLEGDNEIVPHIDIGELKNRKDEYFKEYLKEIEELIDKYPNAYGVNFTAQCRLENAVEKYYEFIDSAELFEQISLLEEKCDSNMKLWTIE